MSIERLYADGIEAEYQRGLRNPGPAPESDFSTWSFLGAGLGGVPAGALEVGGTALDFLSIAERESARRPRPMALRDQPDDVERRKRGLDFVAQGGDLMRRKADEFAPDPQTAHAADQVFFGLTRFGAKAAAAISTAGPIGGAALLGMEEGNTVYQRLIDKGIDPETARQVAAVQGGISALGVVLPISGAAVPGSLAVKATATTGLVAVGGPGAYVAQEGLSRAILQQAGHEQEAALHDPTDPLGLMVSTLLPGAFGALGVRGAAQRAKAVASGGVSLEQMTLGERQKLRYNAPALDAYAESAAERHGVPPALLLAVKNAGEKSGPTATSPKGARGVMQFMPATAKEVGIADPTDPVQSIDGAAKYLRKLYDAYGSWDAAVAHYNGGGAQAAIVRGGDRPTFPETAAYLDRVRKYATERTAADGAKAPEVVDAARVRVLDETTTRALPDTPDAYAQMQRAADIVAESGGRPAEEMTPPVRDIDLPQFREWFAGSRVVDEAGAPMVAYHVTGRDFDSFKTDGNRTTSGDELNAAFFTKEADYAQEYATVKQESGEAPQTVPAYLALRNPLEVSADARAFSDPRYEGPIIKQARAAGHDGVIFKDAATGDTFYAVFDPKSIKSAIGNSGKFDPNSRSLTDPLQPGEAPIRWRAAPQETANALPPADSVTIAAPAAPRAQAEAGGASPEAQFAKRLAEERPDLSVILPGSEERITIATALERIQQQKKDEAQFADLVKIAAECALMAG